MANFLGKLVNPEGQGSIDTLTTQQQQVAQEPWMQMITDRVDDLSNRESLEYKARGDGREFDENDYQVRNYSYPDDLMSQKNSYGDNYVIFYINVSSDSKMFRNLTDDQVSGLTVSDIDPRDRGDLIAQNLNTTQVTTAGALTGAGVLGALTGSGSFSLAGAVVGGATALGVASQSAGFTRPQKRLKTAIALHVPNTLNISYGVQFQEDSTFMFQAAAEVGRVAGDTAAALIKSAGNLKGITDMKGAFEEGKDLTGRLIDGLKKAVPAATSLGLQTAPSAVGAAAGLASNPKMEQVFKGVDFRTFTFDYQFYPRNENEAANVRRIIETFKYHMHPEFKDDGNWLYIYPSEFDVYYYHGAKENRNVHRHTSCVLTGMNVNYTPQGQFTTFANGMPTQINVALTFKELALLTKDKIKDGM